ncbi:hypothetical protein [Mucisphaera sp.]|uniref:hypothetical protein n=1 Tax=Mucisphaera sp. TaxID=2913024 RepID=UPI003D0C98A2
MTDRERKARPVLTAVALSAIALGVIAIAVAVTDRSRVGEGLVVPTEEEPADVSGEADALEQGGAGIETAPLSSEGDGSVEAILEATEGGEARLPSHPVTGERLLRLAPAGFEPAEAEREVEEAAGSVAPRVVERAAAQSGEASRYARIARKIEGVVAALDRLEARLSEVGEE